MKRILSVGLAVLLCVTALTGCSLIERIGEIVEDFDTSEESFGENEPAYSTCEGYIVVTKTGCFFVSTEEEGILRAEDFIYMKPCDDSVSFKNYQTGDKISVKILTVEESYPMQATVYGIGYLSGRYVFEEMYPSVFERLEELGYEVILRDSDLVRPYDAGYGIFLPTTGQTVSIAKQYERYISCIDEDLIQSAELALLERTAKYKTKSDFYLSVDETGHLNLTVEVIAEGSSDGEIDHEHIFFSERITR